MKKKKFRKRIEKHFGTGDRVHLILTIMPTQAEMLDNAAWIAKVLEGIAVVENVTFSTLGNNELMFGTVVLRRIADDN